MDVQQIGYNDLGSSSTKKRRKNRTLKATANFLIVHWRTQDIHIVLQFAYNYCTNQQLNFVQGEKGLAIHNIQHHLIHFLVTSYNILT
jgi:hypothetical protein